MKKRVLTRFDEKQMELDRIKDDFRRYLGRLNSLRLHYRDWFDRQFQSFLDAIKIVQLTFPCLVPREIVYMSQFEQTLEFVKRLPQNGKTFCRNFDKMTQFHGFWNRFCELKKEGDVLNASMCAFCDSITRLREPQLRLDIDKMQSRLDQASKQDFNFTELHNERDNLFVYRIAGHDDKLQPLVGYLPYLLKIATGICYWSTKLYIEKE
ncbi:uncharacterized protein LOC124137466 [Haliotis rufescens]|uniref:uncharacterized protein LOC124137466 n=1 Tax=Haliotis rufescens TaxID=6454 RepID=UPI00201FA302|nr:uncharacterized protein LOC124137466 [Haliotis rufescens]XP_046359726.2 uncharacterized protein LOC124137466 [Haliotis rufescens]